jgi:hypothetical protein
MYQYTVIGNYHPMFGLPRPPGLVFYGFDRFSLDDIPKAK